MLTRLLALEDLGLEEVTWSILLTFPTHTALALGEEEEKGKVEYAVL